MQGAGPGASVGLVVLDVTRGRGPAQDQEEVQMIVICSSPGGRWLQQQRRRRPSPGCCWCRSGSGWWTWRRRCWRRRRTWRCGAGGAAGGCCSLLHLCYEEQEEACGQPSKVNTQHRLLKQFSATVVKLIKSLLPVLNDLCVLSFTVVISCNVRLVHFRYIYIKLARSTPGV